MKRYFFFALFVLPCLLVNGQEGAFKTRTKKPSGPINSEIRSVITKTGVRLKSASAFRLPETMNLETPSLTPDDQTITKVIRQGNSTVYIERKSLSLKAGSEERLNKFLEETKAVSGLKNPRETFKVSEIRTDELGFTHIKTIQQYKGIEIYGSESVLHIGDGKERFTGSFRQPAGNTATTPETDLSTAISTVISDLKTITVYRELSSKEREILDYTAPVSSLLLYEKTENDYRLVWAVTVRPNFIEEWKYFVDAVTGEIIHKFNNTNSDGPATATATDLNGILRSLGTYLEAGTYYLLNMAETMYVPLTGEGIILTLDANGTSTSNLDYKYVTSSNNTWPQQSAVSAHYNATQAYRYFMTTHGRNSINGKGGNIISFVNVADDDGTSMENAFWNGKAVFYGNGGSSFSPLAGALDVAAHELGHGVVSSTANLEYYGQSGAINESYADIFGAMVDRNDWLIGEDITKTSFSPSGALRNMADPHNRGTSISQPYWQPKTVSEMYLGSQDNAGVHINSGIVNYAYYLYATAVTREKAEKVFYRALENYLTTTSKFIDLRIAVTQAASDLYGSSSPETVKAGDAFTAVGIQEQQPVEKTKDYTVNPGQEYLLSYDTDNSDPSTLFRSSVTGTDLLPLSTTVMKGKVSVTDDGTAAYFISSDSKLRGLSLNPSSPDEFILSDSPDWDNVAVSKGGERIALISTQVDTAIYIYDFDLQKMVKFHLYNPTTSQFNTNAGGVLYADAVEFDASGQYIIYDACNVFSSSTGEDIYYWDIGFINVWDNSTGTFGDGTITKLYGSLAENVSIGNPVFSKNSPWIIAFDYFDNVAGEYGVFGANLNTGAVKLIYENTILGYPSFSKNDDKIAISKKTASAVEYVTSLGLAADKISPSGVVTDIVGYAKWPVFYATGDRFLGLPPVADFTADVKSGSAPLRVKYVDLSANKPTSWAWTFEGGTPGTSTLPNPEISYSVPGTYRVILSATNSDGSNTNTKNGYITVATASGIDDAGESTVRIYPNPVTDLLTVICEEDFSVRLLDIDGKMILKIKNRHEIDMSAVKPGIYILEINTGNEHLRQKLVKK